MPPQQIARPGDVYTLDAEMPLSAQQGLHSRRKEHCLSLATCQTPVPLKPLHTCMSIAASPSPDAVSGASRRGKAVASATVIAVIIVIDPPRYLIAAAAEVPA